MILNILDIDSWILYLDLLTNRNGKPKPINQSMCNHRPEACRPLTHTGT